MDTVRDRVLRGIALNREPGFHYAGNFLGISYDLVAKGGTMHPVATRPRRESNALAESELDPPEREILRHADAVLEHGESGFISRFLGYEAKKSADGATCVLRNGAHVGNRVGHVQGGILVGLGAATASAALPSSWTLSSISAWFVSPGEGKALEASSRVSHHGRHTAVVRTEVIGPGGRRVLEVVTAHARRNT